MRRLLFTAIIMLTISATANAQFYQQGNEPASLKWSQFESKNYRLIYPRGLDSLATVFDTELEHWRIPVGGSLGFIPNQQYKRPMQVVLHPLNATANGSVAWAPRRMELFTVPDAYAPESLPWTKLLAIHEGRHVAQMQFGKYKGFRIMSTLFGQAWTGIMCAVYTGSAFLEGDAVTAETALTDMGRGRSADFLEYNMVAFGNGDYRNWYQWRYGSIRKATPDYYKLGYLTIAGMRSFYDQPTFTKYYYDRIFNRYFGYPFFNFQKSVKELSGKPLRHAWKEIAKGFADEWADNAAQRGPFMESETIMEIPRWHMEYKGSTSDGEDIFAIESGLRVSRSLVRIGTDGSVSKLMPFSASTSPLMWSEPMQRIFWSETISDIRWDLKEKSVIRWYDPSDGSKGNLCSDGRLFNPAPHPAKKLIAVTEYPVTGGSALLILDAEDGSVKRRISVPGSLQAVETAWQGDELLLSAISDEGFGIYSAFHGFETVVKPQTGKIKQLRTVGDHVEFLCDRNGVHELYSLENGTVRQLTNTRYGISDAVHIDGKLYYSSLGLDGRLVTVSTEQPGKEIDFSQRWLAPTPEKLSRQERELAAADIQPEETPGHGEARNYHRLGHLSSIHSWAPIYFDYDNIKGMSFDEIQTDLTPGATIMFQNNHGMSGSLGYSWDGQKSAYHARLTYSGLYPVIEAKVDINDREARSYSLTEVQRYDEDESRLSASFVPASYASVYGSLRTYVPMTFSRGGWNRGIVPVATLSFNNDSFNTSVLDITAYPFLGEEYYKPEITGYHRGHVVPMTRLGLSVRGYSMLSTPAAAVFPRLGIGAEAGYGLRPGMTRAFNSNLYSYIYGYLPGILDGHGVKLSSTTQVQINGSYPHFHESYVTVIPDGLFDETELEKHINNSYPVQSMLKAEYAFPAVPLDWAGLGPVAYVRNMVFRFKGDFACYGKGLPDPGSNLYGIGASVSFSIGNLLWAPFDGSIGVEYIRNGGSLIATAVPGASLNHIGTIFSLDF